MGMDVRDLEDWVRESVRRRLERREEAYNVILLPHQKPEEIRKEVESIHWQIYELEHGDDLDELDRRAQEKRKRDAPKLKPRKKGV